MIFGFLFTMLIVSIFGYFDKRLTEYVGLVYVVVCARIAGEDIVHYQSELLLLASAFAIYLLLLTGYMLAFKPDKCNFYRRRVSYYLWSALPIYFLFLAVHCYKFDSLPQHYWLHVTIMLGFCLLFYPVVSVGIWLETRGKKQPML